MTVATESRAVRNAKAAACAAVERMATIIDTMHPTRVSITLQFSADGELIVRTIERPEMEWSVKRDRLT